MPSKSVQATNLRGWAIEFPRGLNKLFAVDLLGNHRFEKSQLKKSKV
jgi:hypothetical protein